MPLFFLDSSALAKQYRTETGTSWIQQLTQPQPIAVSTLVIVEVNSAMARLVREGAMTADRRSIVLQRFALDVEAMLVVGLERNVIEDAARLVIQAPESGESSIASNHGYPVLSDQSGRSRRGACRE